MSSSRTAPTATVFGQRQRELGDRRRTAFGEKNREAKFYAEHLTPVAKWDPTGKSRHMGHGGIFGLEFTQDGALLGVASEHRSILFFDPLDNLSLTSSVKHAHSDCINCLKFIDSRLFVTASDDKTVKLWDLRYLNRDRAVRTLVGHSGWVKNIEFVAHEGRLVTSGFDSQVFSWNLNSSTSSSCMERLWHLEGLVRMRMTADCNKMIVSTQWGYLVVVHDLDLAHLAVDLEGFRANSVWIAQQTDGLFPVHGDQLGHFCARRNRVEMITDFPDDSDPDSVNCIAPHPHSWAVATRSNNADERSEWTCVHDIQTPSYEELIESGQLPGAISPVGSKGRRVEVDRSMNFSPLFGNTEYNETTETISSPVSSSQSSINERNFRTFAESLLAQTWFFGEKRDPVQRFDHGGGNEEGTMISLDDPVAILRQQRRTLQRMRNLVSGVSVSANLPSLAVQQMPSTSAAQNLHLDGSLSPVGNSVGGEIGRVTTFRRRPISAGGSGGGTATLVYRTSRHGRPLRTIVILRPGEQAPTARRTEQEKRHGDTSESQGLPRCYKRLTHYSQEPRVGRGFIKELNWTADGRFLASPYGFGVRVLALDDACRELCDVAADYTAGGQRIPVALREVTTSLAHSDVVLSTKFSPKHDFLLATGCLTGHIALHQPRF